MCVVLDRSTPKKSLGVRIGPLCGVRNYVKLRAAVIGSRCFYVLGAPGRVALQLHTVLPVSGTRLPRQESAKEPAGQQPDSSKCKDSSARADSRWPSVRGPNDLALSTPGPRRERAATP